MFSFYPKNGRPGSRKTSITKVWLFVESWPTPHWLTFLTFYRSTGLRYTLSFEWSDFGLKDLVTVILKGQPPKFKTIVWSFSISETGSKCNSVIIVLLVSYYCGTEKKGRVQFGIYILSQFVFQGVQKFTLNLGWSKIL